VGIFGRLVLVWWLDRDKKSREANAAARIKERAEAIQAMQEVSYWIDNHTAKREAAPVEPTSRLEIMTIARMLARKRIDEELGKKGFRLRDFSVSEIEKAADALLTARRPQIVEQAKARPEEMKVKRSPLPRPPS
jgi:hypothetical protein